MNTNFIIMGLPASGKTTFLAALWHLVEANETECRLKLDGCSGDFTYLNMIAEAWRTFKPVPRTSQIGDKDVTIQLINLETNVSGQAFFPDLAGETFDRQVEDRVCKPEFIEALSQNWGILFFINADVKEDALSINEFNARIPVDVSDATSTGEGEPAASPPELREWTPRDLPAQVKIVQLLSDLIRPPFAPLKRRIAVLISAWDLVREMQLTPSQWLTAHMPLVDQFLKSNQKYFESQIYGVSAQGVKLEDDQAIDELARRSTSQRIQIVGQEMEGNDLTEPLLWLMSVKE
ncbi:hypothetical protein [Pectobacterium polaris]|uniref:TRAFAC clade GTPase domain-containing protein n=1 Tax=Pectobacterium polaris TaxID=2042057 RepID=UPI001583EEC1|nr:hypothetical protein [Pectobacterium polaris]